MLLYTATKKWYFLGVGVGVLIRLLQTLYRQSTYLHSYMVY